MNNTYIFTFGLGGNNKGKFQPVVASDANEARNLMFRSYGSDWAFMYTEEEFEDSKSRGYFKTLEPLSTIEGGE